MFKSVYNWIDERLDVTPIWRDVADTKCLSMLTRRIISPHSYTALAD
ncbi:Menaquinol-cytochrome c reductase cytochrome b subunit [Paenibacillus sp. P1XP2]|nr:Menaquinol-cytochrome c reductase cytochrome b subunit [Paenibacillus sp. P1XP2]